LATLVIISDRFHGRSGPDFQQAVPLHGRFQELHGLIQIGPGSVGKLLEELVEVVPSNAHDPGLRYGPKEISSQGENSGRRHAVRRKRQAALIWPQAAEPKGLDPCAVSIDEQDATKASHFRGIFDLELIVGIDRGPGQPQGLDGDDKLRTETIVSTTGVAPSENQRLRLHLHGLDCWSTTLPDASITVTSKGI